MDAHSINCQFTDIPVQLTNVNWDYPSITNLGLSPSDGTLIGTSQTSSLAISSAQLVMLRAAGTTHVIRCSIAVGDVGAIIQSTQSLSIYSPGRSNLFFATVT